MKRTHVTWVPIGFAIGFALLALVTMFGGLNGTIKAWIEDELAESIGGRVTIDSMDGNPFAEFSLSRVELADSAQVVFRCGQVLISYRPVSLLWGPVVVDTIKFTSPRLEVAREEGPTAATDPDVFLAGLPSADLRNIQIDRGIFTLRGHDVEHVADDLNLDLGFRKADGETTLQIRRLKTLVLDPPIQITNLQGVALSRDDVLQFEDVRVSTPRSSVVVDGEVTGLTSPLYRFDIAVDSLSATEINKVAGTDLPEASFWLSGRVEGSGQRADIAFEWVVGGAAGDIRLRLSDEGGRSHSVAIQGREVDLTALTGVSVRGDFSLQAEGSGLAPDEWTGLAQASISNGSLYGVAVDSVAAEVRYGEAGIEGGLLLDGQIGTFYGAMRVDEANRLSVDGRLVGVDLAAAGGPGTRIDGDLRIRIPDRVTRVDVGLDRIEMFGRPNGRLEASLSQSSDGLHLDRLDWADRGTFEVSASGALWGREDGLFDVGFRGWASPGDLLDIPIDEVERVTINGRTWSEPLAYGATRNRLSLNADLSGLAGLSSLRAEITAEGDRLAIERFEAGGETARLTVTGETILESAFDLQANYQAESLDGIPDILRKGASGDDIRVTVSAVGPWEDPEVLAQVVSSRLEIAGGTFDELTVDANVPVQGEGGLSLQARSASWGGRVLPGFYADVGSSGSEISFLIGNSDGSENLVAVWGVATDDEDSLAVRVDSARIQLKEVYVANQGPVSLTYTESEGMTIHKLHMAGPSGELRSVPGGQAGSIGISVTDLDLAPWAFLIGRDGGLEGILNGSVSIEHEGLWSTNADFEVVEARVDSFRAERLFSEVSYKDRRLFGRVGADLGTGQVYVEGLADLDIDDVESEVDFRLVSESVPLAAFDAMFPQLSEIDGELSGQVWMTGLSSDVLLNGDLRASSARFRVPALNRGLDNVTLELDVSPEALSFGQLEGIGTTGSLSAIGTIGLHHIRLDRLLDDPIFGAMELTLTATNLDAIDTNDIKATVDGQVGLSGTLQNPALSGKVRLEKAEIRMLSILQTPPDPESIWRTVPFFQNLTCELELIAERQLWVRDEAVNVELAGDLDILRSNEDLIARRSDELGFRFFGSMNSLRGTYTFQNRNFRIYREEEGDGGLRFEGERSGAPEVDIKAWARFPIFAPGTGEESERQDVTITANVRGSFEQPEVLLYEVHPDDLTEGEPVDRDLQARLLSYILFGRDPDLLIAAEQNLLSEQSTGMLLGLATRQFQSRLAQSLNLDLVQVEMGSASSIDRVTVGKYISDRLFVTYEDQIGQGREFGVEYELFPRFSLESRFEETPDGQVQPSLRFTWGKDW